MKPHVHAEIIKAWANGTQIQFRHYITREWVDIDFCNALFSSSEEYRIKPEEKKPVVRWPWADEHGFVTSRMQSEEEVRHGLTKLEWSRTEFPK